MKIIQTKLKDMPSSLLAELGSYRYSVYAREEGWSIPSRLSTPGQEYDRFDRSDVTWIIAWNAQHGICGCARLIEWHRPEGEVLEEAGEKPALPHALPIWEMSRFSARLDIDATLPLSILWHSVQLAEQSGVKYLYSAATPMLEQMFAENNVVYAPLSAGVIQSEDNLFAISIPVEQPHLAAKFHGARRFSPAEVLPSLGVSANWNKTR